MMRRSTEKAGHRPAFCRRVTAYCMRDMTSWDMLELCLSMAVEACMSICLEVMLAVSEA
jgi:hypothetical protein